MTRIGYARVSTSAQNLDGQRDALAEAGCERVFEDVVTGAKAARPGLDGALDWARPGDTLVVCALDRLARNLRDLIGLGNRLAEAGVGLVSLREAIDTGTPAGVLVFHLFGALAEFERETIRERTRAGLAAGRARGRLGGRRRALSDGQLSTAQLMYDTRQFSIEEIARAAGVSPRTLYRYLTITQGAQTG